MPKWEQHQLRMNKNHSWKAKKGNVIFVADRGAVRFDIPETWIIDPEKTPLEITDRKPPDDDAKIRLTLMRLNPEIDWRGVSFVEAFEQTLSGGGGEGEDEAQVLWRGPAMLVNRPGADIVWAESRLMDPVENRESLCFMCLGHKDDIQIILTLDYWPEDAERCVPIWHEVMRTLRLGQYVSDPRQGPGGHRPPPRRGSSRRR